MFPVGVDMFLILRNILFFIRPELADSFENMIHDNVDVYSLEVLLRNAFEFMVMYDALSNNNKQARVNIAFRVFDAFPIHSMENATLLVSHACIIVGINEL